MKAKTSIKTPVHFPHVTEASTEFSPFFSKRNQIKLGLYYLSQKTDPPTSSQQDKVYDQRDKGGHGMRWFFSVIPFVIQE